MNILFPSAVVKNVITKKLFIKTFFVLFTSVSLIACNDTRSVEDATTQDDTTDSGLLSLFTDPPDYTEFDDFENLYLSSEPTHSIWPRMRAGFQISTITEHQAMLEQLAWFTKHPRYIQRVMDRADPFLYYILEEAEKRDLPSELVLLPIVESAFQPFAYSHGRAAGLWQFIPSTGRSYGLKQNWWYDGRRDIYESTQAALNYLERLHKIFNGDWKLALAAYNSGSGTVQRAVKRNRKLNRPTDFWSLELPRETQAYVPKLLALKEVISHPEKYDVSLPCIPDAPGFKQVTTNAQIDLALAAELAEVDLDTIYSYNPGFNRWATDPDGPHSLILPIESAEIFEMNYPMLSAEDHLRWTRHKIKAGETLSQIAVKYKTSTKHLRTVNDLPDNDIREGKYLMIPVASKDGSSYSLSSSQRLKSLQDRKRGSKSNRINHIVKHGESFWEIAKKYKVDMHSLAKWNGMAIKDRLKKGQKLVVWAKGKQSTARTHNPNSTIKSIHYTVRNGDSLSLIANKYNVGVKDLHRWNTIEGKYLKPGQRLKLYIDVTEQSGAQS